MERSGYYASYVVGELASAAAIVGALLSWLPAIATVMAIIWYVILIMESRTGAAWLARLRIRKDAAAAREEIKEHAVIATEMIKEQATLAIEATKHEAAAAAEKVIAHAVVAADALKNGPTIIAADLVKNEAVSVAQVLRDNPPGSTP